MKTCLFLSLVLSLGAAVHAETSPANAVVAEAEPVLERAYLTAAGSAKLSEAVKPIEAALAVDPKNPALLYERAFASYAATTALRAPGKEEALIAQLEKTAAALERVKGQPWEAEAAALRSNILGNLIGLKGGMSGMVLGPKSGSLLARAEKALPSNPRVLLFRGISLLNTPAAFGGDPKKGAQTLQAAVDAFAQAGTGTAAGPRWGQADALAWLGLAKKQAGDVAGARAAWEQALALQPRYAWVKFALLPSLDQKAGQ